MSTSKIHAGNCPQEDDVVFDIHAKTPPAFAQALEGYRRDLPELLKNKGNDRKWIAYNSEGRVITKIHASYSRLYKQCLRSGYRDGEYLICCICPEAPAEIDLQELVDA